MSKKKNDKKVEMCDCGNEAVEEVVLKVGIWEVPYWLCEECVAIERSFDKRGCLNP